MELKDIQIRKEEVKFSFHRLHDFIYLKTSKRTHTHIDKDN